MGVNWNISHTTSSNASLKSMKKNWPREELLLSRKLPRSAQHGTVLPPKIPSKERGGHTSLAKILLNPFFYRDFALSLCTSDSLLFVIDRNIINGGH